MNVFLCPGDYIDERLYNYIADIIPPAYCSRDLMQGCDAIKNEGDVLYYITVYRTDDNQYYISVFYQNLNSNLNKLKMSKSEEYIEIKSFVVVNPNFPVITKESALKAVAMAEEEMKRKAIEVLSSVLDNWVHGGDADCIIAEFEERLTEG